MVPSCATLEAHLLRAGGTRGETPVEAASWLPDHRVAVGTTAPLDIPLLRELGLHLLSAVSLEGCVLAEALDMVTCVPCWTGALQALEVS